MDYVIVTYGGGETLIDVFNAIGRIFASDSTYLTPVGKLGMSMGCLWAGIRAIYKADLATFFTSWLIPSFLAFMLLFSPKASVWIKDEVSLDAPVKIDNIPFGIAFFSSIPSQISSTMANLIEEHFLPLNMHAGKNGVMFGAKAVGSIRDVKIEDPNTLYNAKEYMRQCYMKPYIMGNFGGHKNGASNTGNILEYLRTNPVQNFGIYYKDLTGARPKFKTCAEVNSLITESVNKEINITLLSRFATSIGIESRNKDILNRRLKSMTENTLRYLDVGQTDLNKWMQQAMILNANRESYDDWREKFNLHRIHPNLISMQSTRGMFQQSIGYLVAGDMIASTMPMLQTALMSLIVCLTLIVVPMSLLAGGTNILKTWIMLLIWVNSWPLFFSMINCLGMISIKSAVAGSGSINILSMINQSWFSETLLYKYANYQLLLTLVPPLSWAVLKGCAHSMSSLAGQFSATGIAAALGVGSADANISMRTKNYDNTTEGQHNYAPSLQYGGGTIDDGSMRVTSDQSGNQVITEHTDVLANNYRASEQYSSSLSTQLSDASSSLSSLSQRHSALTTTTDNQVLDMAHRIADGTATIDGMSTSEQNSFREAINRTLAADDRYGDNMSANTATTTDVRIGANANVGLQTPSLNKTLPSTTESGETLAQKHQPARFAGGGVGIGISGGGSTGVSATNNDAVTHDLSAVESISRNEALEKVKTAVKNNSISSNSDDTKSLSKSLNRSLSELEQVGNEIAKTQQQVVTLAENKGYLEQNSGSIDRNMNEQVLNKVIKSNPGMKTKEQGVRWMKENPVAAEAIARSVIATQNPFGANSLNSNKKTQGLIDQSRSAGSNVSEAIVNNSRELKDKHNKKEPIKQPVITGAKEPQAMPQDVDKALDNMLIDSERYVAGELNNMPSEINDKKSALTQKFKDGSKSTAVRAVEQAIDNLKIFRSKNEDEK